MLGGVTPLTTVLGAAPPADADLPRLKSFVRAACAAGLWLLLIEPGGKGPVDMRSAVQRRLDDGAAQDAARAAGQPGWDKVKSKGGVYLATNDADRLIRYLDRYRKEYPDAPVNFGVDVGRSGYLVVDCDTAEQVQAFLEDFEVDAAVPPTVRTPGQFADGQWSHKDGGHFYFRLDEPLPAYSGSLTAPGRGYVLLWANRYVLIPPSVRPEGAYQLTGQDFPAPRALIDLVTTAVQTKMERRRAGEADAEAAGLKTVVDDWARTVDWEDLLAPAGWVLTARLDTCGCEIWTAPGEHASPKSATAHDVACTLGRYTTENAPLHIWTDYPGPELEAWITAQGGGKTMSKLQVAAALHYEGNVGKAMRSLGVVPRNAEALSFGPEVLAEHGASLGFLDAPLPPPDPPQQGPGDADPFVTVGSAAPDDTAPATDEPAPSLLGVPNIQPFNYWREYPAPEFVVEGVLESGSFSALIGQPGIGKTGVALDLAASITTGQPWMGRRTLRQRVLYLPGEGLSGAVQRIKAWESAHDIDLGEDFFVGDSIIQVSASPEAWAAVIARMLEYNIGQLIVDTFARASVGLEENSATDVGKAVARFDQVRKATGCGLMVVHHTRKDGNSGRGSSALNGALDTELLVAHGQWWDDTAGPCPGRALELLVTKQKNAAQPEEGIPMLAMPHGDSFVMTGPSGTVVGDPLDAFVTPKAISPETIINVAIRLQEYAQRFTAQGLTRSEFAYGVAPDAYTAQRRDMKTAWRMRVNEAVDLCLRYNMLQTLTGTATGARYIPDVTTPDQARARWSQEQMNATP